MTPALRIIGFLAALSVSWPARAEELPFWQELARDCEGMELPGFRADAFRSFVRKGNAWQRMVDEEIPAIEQVAGKSCREYMLNPNGHEALKKFTTEYGGISRTAVEARREAGEDFARYLEAQLKSMQSDAARSGFDVMEYPCGRALIRGMKHLKLELAEIEGHFRKLKASCPVAAENDLKNAAAARERARAAEARIPASAVKNTRSENTGSSITGVELDKAKRSKTP